MKETSSEMELNLMKEKIRREELIRQNLESQLKQDEEIAAYCE